MRTYTKNQERVNEQEITLTQEQLDQLNPILDEIKCRREMGLEEYYTVEEVMEELDQIIEEAKKK